MSDGSLDQVQARRVVFGNFLFNQIQFRLIPPLGRVARLDLHDLGHFQKIFLPLEFVVDAHAVRGIDKDEQFSFGRGRGILHLQGRLQKKEDQQQAGQHIGSSHY